MSKPQPGRPRVIIYVFASPYLVGAAEDGFRADMVELCVKEDLDLVEIVVDHGPPKRHASEYPALARVARGEADGVLAVRSALFQRGQFADRLEELCPEGPSAWLPAEALKEGGMLPKRPKAPRRRRTSAKRRVAELRAMGLSSQQILQVLQSEGYRRRGNLPWTESAAGLLGLTMEDRSNASN